MLAWIETKEEKMLTIFGERVRKNRKKQKELNTKMPEQLESRASKCVTLVDRREFVQSDVRIPLAKARLCVDCEHIHMEERCPACTSASFLPLRDVLNREVKENSQEVREWDVLSVR